MWQKASQWSEIAAQVRQESIAAVRQAWPEQTKTQQMTNPRRVAETLRETELRESKPFEAPPRPRPILEEAFRIAAEAARDSGGSAFPGYIAGLAAWALNRPEAALAYFEHAARSEIAAPAPRRPAPMTRAMSRAESFPEENRATSADRSSTAKADSSSASAPSVRHSR